jgi:hypothetical protein
MTLPPGMKMAIMAIGPASLKLAASFAGQDIDAQFVTHA